MKKVAIILAGGEGLRAGGNEPKQFRMLAGKPALWWSLKAFIDEDPKTKLIVVIHPNFIYDWEETINQMPECDRFNQSLICGGHSRWHSVYNALLDIEAEDDLYIAVHDGARPLIDVQTIRRGWEHAYKYNAAVPTIPLSDSIRHIDTDNHSCAVNRKEYVAVQTPQIFASHLIKKAYSLPESDSFTDDASVIEAIGGQISLYEGNTDNIKITYPHDISIAELIMNQRK